MIGRFELRNILRKQRNKHMTEKYYFIQEQRLLLTVDHQFVFSHHQKSRYNQGSMLLANKAENDN